MSYRCGHCGVTTAINKVANLPNSRHLDENALVEAYASTCASCAHSSIRESWIGGHAWYPPEGWQRVRNIAKVPDQIAGDYEEAVNCLNTGQNKASAVMARRTVQGVCVDLGADPSTRLVDQIDQLKNESAITPKLADLAHKTRVLGNDGAHPRKDGLDALEQEDAESAIEFVEHLLQHVYII